MEIKIGDTCRVIAGWCNQEELKKTKVRVVGVQHNGNETFCRITWNSDDLAEKYGVLFSPSELRKVK
jgi:hypothetical protein